MEKLYIIIKKTLHSFINAQSEKTNDHQELEELKRVSRILRLDFFQSNLLSMIINSSFRLKLELQ